MTIHQDEEALKKNPSQRIHVGDWVEIVSPNKWDGCEGIVKNVHNTGFGYANFTATVAVETQGERGATPVLYVSELRKRGA
jgi:hypothetical protein